ncbi:hypothetical protein KGQ27_01100 [Patescibacteria group bacterium]|nr:hypothetical protein [Patescibacteria group bacterium]MDE1946557.1 hypothetical protein [Patescibacteria group bacterium]MDE2010882.1 hypothetical protein [Patescibacteria group bacterium]MDE2232766.1 hypothetical protein [Patescibacteria group bacterium]
MNKLTIRIVLDIILFVCIVNAWWYFALPLAVVGAFAFPFYIEFIVAGIMYDALFAMVQGMGVWAYSGTIVSLVLFIMITTLKNFIRR